MSRSPFCGVCGKDSERVRRQLPATRTPRKDRSESDGRAARGISGSELGRTAESAPYAPPLTKAVVLNPDRHLEAREPLCDQGTPQSGVCSEYTERSSTVIGGSGGSPCIRGRCDCPVRARRSSHGARRLRKATVHQVTRGVHLQASAIDSYSREVPWITARVLEAPLLPTSGGLRFVLWASGL
jgi:hypothetical protein